MIDLSKYVVGQDFLIPIPQPFKPDLTGETLRMVLAGVAQPLPTIRCRKIGDTSFEVLYD